MSVNLHYLSKKQEVEPQAFPLGICQKVLYCPNLKIYCPNSRFSDSLLSQLGQYESENEVESEKATFLREYHPFSGGLVKLRFLEDYWELEAENFCGIRSRSGTFISGEFLCKQKNKNTKIKHKN